MKETDWLDLKFVLELSRHGHRSSFKAAGVHEPKLSQDGEIQSYKQGLRRREFYIDEVGFLSQKYKQLQVMIASTQTQRTFASAE